MSKLNVPRKKAFAGHPKRLGCLRVAGNKFRYPLGIRWYYDTLAKSSSIERAAASGLATISTILFRAAG